MCSLHSCVQLHHVLKLNHLKRKMEEVLKDLYRVKVMVFNATFNNFSVIFQRPF